MVRVVDLIIGVKVNLNYICNRILIKILVVLKLFIIRNWFYDVFDSNNLKDICIYICILIDNEWNFVFCRSWICVGLGVGIWNVIGFRGCSNYTDLGFLKGN